MELKNFNVYFFFLALLGISIVTFLIFQPFFISILLAAILAVIFQKPFGFFLRLTGNRRKISAFLTASLGMIIFIVLFLGVIGLGVKEISTLYQNITAGSGVAHQTYIDRLVGNINTNPMLVSLGLNNLINSDTIRMSATDLSQNIFGILQKTYQNVANFFFMSVVMLFTMYYFLIGGRQLVDKVIYLSPLRDSHEKILIDKFVSISSSTVKGTLIIGIIQGIVGGALFAAVGIPSAIVWGVFMMFLSLIPMVGTGLVWLPAAIIMFLMGNIWQGAVILAVGFGVISVIDNFLKPKLVSRNSQMHPLIVFFAILGGLAMFGLAGFILGPVIVALFLALWDIYAVEFKGQLRNYNS
jgi:predicted PurR-regulated permease PerM